MRNASIIPYARAIEWDKPRRQTSRAIAERRKKSNIEETQQKVAITHTQQKHMHCEWLN